MKKLDENEFKQIVRNTPLLSIDLIIENKEGEILLGWRKNLPAKGFWFVPGGRIVKDENFESAFSRIIKIETGYDFAFQDAVFMGVYEHLYPGENFSGDPTFGTHYVVLAYWIKLTEDMSNLPSDQHEEYWWANLDDIEVEANVHQNTKNYFNGFPSFSG